MKKELNLDDLFYPDHDKLIIKDEQATAVILDAELDAVECEFNYDGCVHINTEGLTYICLTRENLSSLLNLIEESEEYYESLNELEL